jgi:hypothetical protein
MSVLEEVAVAALAVAVVAVAVTLAAVQRLHPEAITSIHLNQLQEPLRSSEWLLLH